MSGCTHTETVEGHWVENTDSFYDDDDMLWEEEYERSTTVDIDLHRYKCTQCGKIFNY